MIGDNENGNNGIAIAFNSSTNTKKYMPWTRTFPTINA